MRKYFFFLLCAALLFQVNSEACTNIIISKGASTDGSTMVSYAADSHHLYGELYFHKASRNSKGSLLPIIEWDSQKPLGSIAQVERTFQTVGNSNVHQLTIGETTWGGREEQVDTTGIMDYGSLIYVTLQRARTAREAIATIVALANEYGYPSEGESFSIADPDEVWVMDLVGKGCPAPGAAHPGIVWVARRIPDGYICAHANQARITRFPLNDPENTLYAPDVISYAREKGWFNGPDEEFSFREAYCPLDFGGVRGCDARVWAAFNRLCDGVFTYEENGKEVSRPAGDWLKYAMGFDLSGEMPLFVKPSRKISVKNVADAMRDHYEDTPMDMRNDIGAGGHACPYRWRPMDFTWQGKTYGNERAIATQQTGFWFVSQSRGWLPDEVGALLWFGCDDAATSYLTPIYVNTREIPECLRVGNGSLLEYSPTSTFWNCNRVTNFCYCMYDRMAPVVRAAADEFENRMMNEAVPEMDKKLLKVLGGRGGSCGDRSCGRGDQSCGRGGLLAWFRTRRAVRMETRFSVETAQTQFSVWKKLDEMLLVKFMDGNVKAQNEDGSFKHSKWSAGVPDGLTQPGYSDTWKAAVATDPHASVLEVPSVR